MGCYDDRLDDATVRRFLEHYAEGDEAAAVANVRSHGGSDETDRFLNDLFGVSQDGWFHLVADDIDGDCLVVTPGTGRHLSLVSALAETVYALEPSATQRRLIRARHHHRDVVPLGGTLDNLPLEPSSFDTIVATSAPSGDDLDVYAHLEQFASLLRPTGSLVIELDGLTRASGLTKVLGLEGNGPGSGGEPTSSKPIPSPSTVLQALLPRYASRLEGAGFDEVELYALAPTADRFEWMVPLADRNALEWLLETQRPTSTYGRALHAGAVGAARVGLLDHAWPSYVAVCRPNERSQRDRSRESDRLLKRGANRSLVFELDDDGDLDRVRKIPTDPRHAHFNERAASVRTTLAQSGSSLSTDVPPAELEDSRLGAVLVEPPMRGTPILETVDLTRLERDPATFAAVLDTGLEWVEKLQTERVEEHRELTPGQAVADLSIDELGFEPPTPQGTLRVPNVPAHGDYHPGNLAVDDDGRITTVVDWEYATLEADPVADPMFYTLKLAEFAFGDFETGVRHTFLEETPHSTVVYDRLRTYCRQVGIDVDTVVHYAGATFVRQIALHFEHETSYRHHTTPRTKLAKLEFLYDHADALCERLEQGVVWTDSPRVSAQKP